MFVYIDHHSKGEQIMFNSARYCVRCGRGLRFKMRVCPWCGKKVAKPDKGVPHFLWSWIPVVGWMGGLILYFMLQNEYPRRADSAARGVVAGVCITMGAAIAIFLGKLIFG